MSNQKQYTKPALTFKQQADLLIDRGMEADRDELIEKLQEVSYYRLSGYWYPFQKDGNLFEEGTKFQIVWNRYKFDRQFRLLIMDAIERIEISIRTKLVNEFVLQFGPFGHISFKNFSKTADITKYNDFINKLRISAKNSREYFVLHSKENYREFPDLPLWKVSEIMSFGNMYTMFRMANTDIKKEISIKYGLPVMIMNSWLHSLNYIRNLAAHHGRLWNRELAIKPKIPKNISSFHNPEPLLNNRIYSILCIFKYLLSYTSPKSQWKRRLVNLLLEYQDVPPSLMGIPHNWLDSDLWK